VQVAASHAWSPFPSSALCAPAPNPTELCTAGLPKATLFKQNPEGDRDYLLLGNMCSLFSMFFSRSKDTNNKKTSDSGE